MVQDDRQTPALGVALMLESEFVQAAYPLFEAAEIEILEWSFDSLWSGANPPDWLPDLLSEYSAADRLLGHGVTYSMFSAGSEARAQRWRESLAEECRRRSYHHITEHFGFMLAGDFHRGAPLPVPHTPEILRLGRDRVARLADIAEVPVGLENLAFAFGFEDVRVQGQFLDELLAPTDGFLLLDLHNILCQAHNFERTPDEILQAYPLHRVRELHLSGGSWSESLGSNIRRDTHDGPVPDELLPLLDAALELCPEVESVIFEHLGTALPDATSQTRYREDYQRIARHVRTFRTRPS